MLSKWGKILFSIAFVICSVLILNKNPEHERYMTEILNTGQILKRLINRLEPDVTAVLVCDIHVRCVMCDIVCYIEIF